MRFFGCLVVTVWLIGCDVPESTPPIEYRSDLEGLRLPVTAFDYTPNLPDYFTDASHPLHHWVADFDNTPSNNPVTDAGATLGRVLFYDVRLSANDTVSCASCHQQANGFSDDRIFSRGFQDGLTRRHSMGLANSHLYSSGKFFWDERADTLEAQVLMPIQDAVEMGMDLNTLVGKLAATDEYPVLFEEAFGTPDITEDRMAEAMAQFVRAMVSFQSKFDDGVDQKWANLTETELSGAHRFLGFCGSCHQGPLQAGSGIANNGLDDISTDLDRGVGEVTLDAADDGKFKIPSLRNIAVTAPYMHDGRFQTLEQVLDHYTTGVQNHANLDERLKNSSGEPARFPIGQEQKDEIIAFLHTLTDNALLTDEKFSDPFDD